MKISLSYLFTLLIVSQLFTQISFTSHTITGGEWSARGAWSVFATDVDSDTDIDVLSASSLDGNIA